MQTNEIQPGRVRRAVNDLVLAEMFLVQATLESVAAIGDGFNELGKQLSSDDAEDGVREPLSTLFQRTADEALEPYTTRFRYLRDLIDSES